MDLLAACSIAYRSLAQNKVRAFLTTLGIVIGVAAVITMVALTQGARETIKAQIVSLGGKSLVVTSGTRTRSGITEGTGSAQPLTTQDAEAIRKLTMVTHVAPLVTATERVIQGNRNWYTVIIGTSPDFVSINDWFPERGTFFIRADVLKVEQVCVLGKTVAQQLFGYQNPVGEAVRLRNSSFRVIGVLSPKGQTSGGKDQDDIVVIPYTTLQKRLLGTTHLANIAVAVQTQQDLPLAEALITQLLRERHQIRPGMPDDFAIRTQTDITRRIFTILSVMTLLLGSIASISLVVGGIGIMNIMLVSVTERTREIGIRMAVGAKARDILVQFLIESIVLSLGGGLIGIGLGIVSARLAALVMQFPPVVSWPSIGIAFGFAVAVGVFFGLYPARKASKLDPIEALRYE